MTTLLLLLEHYEIVLLVISWPVVGVGGILVVCRFDVDDVVVGDVCIGVLVGWAYVVIVVIYILLKILNPFMKILNKKIL